jgi:IclR family transcriptional regulator, KDG regulon repressor
MENTGKVRSAKRISEVTHRLFVLLEVLSKQPKTGVPLEELTYLSHLPKTTVHRLLYSMNRLGYVEQDPITNLYALSGKFFGLGPNALPYRRLTEIAMPLMQRLLRTSGESVNLAVPRSGTPIYILVLESQREHRVAATVGSCSYLHCTSVGKSIAAYLPMAERQRNLARRGMPSMTRSSITSLQEFEQELVNVRNEGVAIDNEENARGIICVGGPIFSTTPTPVAALSVSGPTNRMSEGLSATKVAIRETVRAISSLLGGRC